MQLGVWGPSGGCTVPPGDDVGGPGLALWSSLQQGTGFVELASQEVTITRSTPGRLGGTVGQANTRDFCRQDFPLPLCAVCIPV